MSSREISNKSLLKRCIKAPLKLLSTAKSYYAQTVTADYCEYIGNIEDIASPHGYFASHLPRNSSSYSSTSSSSDGNDFQELVEMNSKTAIARASSENDHMNREEEIENQSFWLQRQSSKRLPTSSDNEFVKKVEIEIQNIRLQRQQQAAVNAKLLKNHSERIGTIHEDEALDFGDDLKFSTEYLYPRSRSCAAATVGLVMLPFPGELI